MSLRRCMPKGSAPHGWMVWGLLAGLALLAAVAGLAAAWGGLGEGARLEAWQAPTPVRPDLGPPPRATEVAASSPLALQLLERPLFSPTRRPPPPPPPPESVAPPPPDPIEQARVLGLVGGKAGTVVLWVEGSVRRLRLGDALGGWTLSRVEGRRATFGRGEESRSLELAHQPLGVAPPRAASAPGSAAGGGGATVIPGQIPPQLQDVARRTQEELAERIRLREEARQRALRRVPSP